MIHRGDAERQRTMRQTWLALILFAMVGLAGVGGFFAAATLSLKAHSLQAVVWVVVALIGTIGFFETFGKLVRNS